MEGPSILTEKIVAQLDLFSGISDCAVFDAYTVFTGIDKNQPQRVLRRAARTYEALILEEITEGKHFGNKTIIDFEEKYLIALSSVIDLASEKGIPLNRKKISTVLVANGYSLEKVFGKRGFSQDKAFQERIKIVCKAISLNLLCEDDLTTNKVLIGNVLNGKQSTSLNALERLALEHEVKKIAPELFTFNEYDEISAINIGSSYFYHFAQVDENILFSRIKLLHENFETYKTSGIIGQKSVDTFKKSVSHAISYYFNAGCGFFANQILEFALVKGILTENDKKDITDNVFDLLYKSVINSQERLKRNRRPYYEEKPRKDKVDLVKESLLYISSSITSIKQYIPETVIPENLSFEISKLLAYIAVEKLKIRRRKKTTSK